MNLKKIKLFYCDGSYQKQKTTDPSWLKAKVLKTLIFCVYSVCFANYIQITVQKGDTFNAILKRMNISNTSIDQINLSTDNTPILSKINPDDRIELFISHQNCLISAYIKQKQQNFVLNRHHDGFISQKLKKDPSIRIVTTDTDDDKISEYKIKTKRASKMLFPDHKGAIHAAMKDDKIISLKITSNTNTQYAFLEENAGFPVYKDAKGKLIAPAISRSPTDYVFIASHFNLQRLHPISKKIRPHTGVDLAAAINTPIWAAANGVVTQKTFDPGYGNMIVIQHSNGVESLYAHLNKFHNNIQVGQKVLAFETIGYVGSTGISEGNHLHYEIHLNNKPHDPLTVNFSQSNKSHPLDFNYYF
jgi:murein DD-endopeptidase MepM/ murein hydrolase activator NlpD